MLDSPDDVAMFEFSNRLIANGSSTELEATMTEFATGVANGEMLVPDTVWKALVEIQKEIQKILDNANITRRQDQAEVNRVQDAVLSCNGYKIDLDLAAANVADKERIHGTCRLDQVALNDSKREKCGAYLIVAQNPNPPSCMATFPAVPTPDELRSQLASVRQIATWSASFNATLTQKWEDCDNSGRGLADKILVCNEAQKTYESYFCSYYTQLNGACSSYSTCRLNAISDRSTVYASVRLADTTRKAEYTSALHILCLLEVLNASVQNATVAQQQSMLMRCLNLTTDTSGLDITYNDLPPEQICDTSGVAKRPCDDQWEADKYKSKAWYSKAPTVACTACATAAPLTTTALPTTTSTAAPVPAMSWLGLSYDARIGPYDCVQKKYGHPTAQPMEFWNLNNCPQNTTATIDFGTARTIDGHYWMTWVEGAFWKSCVVTYNK